MPVEVRPLGVRCNIACQYCYQNPERDAGNDLRSYDLEKMMSVLRADGREFILFGGEPLLMPLADLETLWAYGLEKFKGNGIQSNGALITEAHVEAFLKYKVAVGISIDGPDELNDVRWAGSLEKTREATRRTHWAIERLCAVGRPPSMIVTLHRCNGVRERLPRLLAWLRELHALGVSSFRIHLLEVESEAIRSKYSLSTEENIEALLAIQSLEKELPRIKLDLFRDMRNMLMGRDKKNTCVWVGCDPYTTEAVQGLEGSGQRSNCGRTNKDGIDFVKADKPGFERYLALYQTPEEHGGCQGCRFFLMCKGQCPGTALGGDWRNRTEMCSVIKTVYRRLEGELLDQGLFPISTQPVRHELERQFQKAWMQGRSVTMQKLLHRMSEAKTAKAGTADASKTPSASVAGAPPVKTLVPVARA